jgi:hypothetical protein
MTLPRPFALAALFAAALAACHAAAAQESPAAAASASRPKSLAVAVVGGVGTHARPFAVTNNSRARVPAPPRLKGWKPPKGGPTLTRVDLYLAREGDGVRVKVYAVTDDTWPPEAPGPKYGPRFENVASYLAREGETVSVVELRRFGVEPLALSVTEWKPEPEPPAPALSVASRVKSVEVVSFEGEWTPRAERHGARLVLRNVSAKNVVGLELTTDVLKSSESGFAADALIKAGATYDTEVGSGREIFPRPAPPPPLPLWAAVTTVLFDDGTYEGDPSTAAELTASHRGRLIQLARILEIMRETLGGKLDEADAVARLRARVQGLRVDVEPSVLDELAAKFPEVPRDKRRRLVAGAAVGGLVSGRYDALALLGQIEISQQYKDKEPGFDLRRRLGQMRDRLAARAGLPRD